MTPTAKENTGQDTDETSPWRSTLFVMFIAQLLSIVGFAFVLPFIPFYIREIGVTDEKLVPVWAGILGAASSLTMTIFAPIWGWLSDRYGRKLMVERAMFAGAVITMAMGIIGNVYELLILRLLSGAFTGTISASISLVASVLPGRKLGFGLGMMQVAVFLGMSLGPLFGGMIADIVGYRLTFIAGGAILLVGGIVVMIGAKEKFIRPSAVSLKRSGSMWTLCALPGFVSLMVVFLLFNFSIHIAIPILPLFIEEVGNLKTRVASTTGLLFAVTGATASISAAAIGYLSDRRGHKQITRYPDTFRICGRREPSHHECPSRKTHPKGKLREGLRVDGFHDLSRHDAGTLSWWYHGLLYGAPLAFRRCKPPSESGCDPHNIETEDPLAADWPIINRDKIFPACTISLG